MLLAACGSPDDEPAPAADDDAEAPYRDAGSDPAPVHDAGVRDASLPPADASPIDAGVPSCARNDWGPARTFQLAHGAFPDSGHPDVAVHVPSRFDPCRPQGAIVFFHGFNNCVRNVIGNENTACTDGGPVRRALGLVDQLEATDVNAVLIAIELKFDQATGAPGALADDDGTLLLLDELYTEQLSAWFEHDVHPFDLDRILLSSHSGGYTALARALDVGGLTNVSQVDLFDSLYGEVATYQDWTLGQLARFDRAAVDPLRFSIVYTGGGGTADESVAFAEDLVIGLDERTDALLFDDSTETLDDAAYTTPLIVKRSALSHDGVVPYYFGRLLAAAGLPKR